MSYLKKKCAREKFNFFYNANADVNANVDAAMPMPRFSYAVH